MRQGLGGGGSIIITGKLANGLELVAFLPCRKPQIQEQSNMAVLSKWKTKGRAASTTSADGSLSWLCCSLVPFSERVFV